MHFNKADNAEPELQKSVEATFFPHLSCWHLGRLTHR